MSIATLALLAALTAPIAQAEDGPRVERRSEIRIVTTDSDGPGRLDADGDGVVTREEFSAPMGDAFDRLDENDDGRLSTEELAASRGPGGPGGPGRRVMMMGGPGGPGEHDVRIFTHGGPGGPGGPVVIHEGGPGVHVFTSRLASEGVPMPDGPGPHRVFVQRFGGPDGPGEMDTNDDGKVSQDEFLAPLIEAFGRMDADHDGFLDEGENAPPPPAD